MIIPDNVRPAFTENLIGGLSMHLVGSFPVRLVFHVFVVVVGTLILAGAVNTAIVGSNGVFNRVSEDGVLTDWFRHPHPRFGTTHRIINIVVVFQIITIVASRGDVTFLGNLYAFGVIWSFAMKGIAVLVLRYTHPQDREYRVPLNPVIFGVEVPIGLGFITLVLLAIAIINLFTKPAATIAGLTFSAILFTVFEISEHRDQEAASRGVACGARPVQPRAGSGTDADERGSATGKHSGPRQYLLRAVPSGSRFAAREKPATRKWWCCTCGCCDVLLRANTISRPTSFSARSSSCYSRKYWR